MAKANAELPNKGGAPSAAETSANDGALARMKAELDKEEREPKPRDEDPVVRLDEPEDDEPDERPEPERPSRQERRQNRYSEMKSEAQAAREEAAQMKGRLDAMEAYMRHTAESRGAPAPEPPDEMKELLTAKEQLASEYSLAYQAGQITPELYKRYQERYQQVEDRIADARIERRIGAASANIRQQVEREALRAQHADVYDNPRAAQWARGYYHQQLAKGRRDDRALHDESIEQARAEFKLSGRGAPTRESRARYAGSSTGGGSGAAAAQPEAREIVMTKEFRRMANAAFPHIKDDASRYKAWAKTQGSE